MEFVWKKCYELELRIFFNFFSCFYQKIIRKVNIKQKTNKILNMCALKRRETFKMCFKPKKNWSLIFLKELL